MAPLSGRGDLLHSLDVRRMLVSGAMAAVAMAIASCSLVDWDRFTSGSEDGGAALTQPPPEAGSDASPPSPSIDPYGDVVRRSQPAAWFRFEEEAGAAEAKDEMGGPSAKVDPPVFFGQPGVSGRAVGLSQDGLLTPGDVFDFAGKVDHTIEAWVSASSASGDILRKRLDDGAGLRGWIVYLAGDRSVHYEMWGADLSSWTAEGIEPGVFTHVAVVVSYSAGIGNAQVYVNGEPAPYHGFDNRLDAPGTAADLNFGGFLEGALDEVAFYDRALSIDEVRAHHRAGRN